MNTAAPNATYIQTHQTQNQARQDSYAADRISAQEAMKSMRISDSQQNNRRRKSSEMDETYGASRVDRHLANRAMSVRESSKPHSQDRDVSMKVSSASYTKRSRAEPGVAHIDTSPEKFNSVDMDQSDTNGSHQHHQYQSQNHRQSQASYSSAHSHSDYSPAPQAASVTAPSTASVDTTHSQPAPTSGRQSRLSNANSSRESYRRKYGELPGYSYIGTIGQGNFGKVLLAENDLTGEQVAVKILEKAQFKSEQQRLHATREARLMATLRHPNIVDVKTVLEDDARILIVMENLTGGELFDYISNKGSLDEKEARRIFHQIVLAIHYCHENNVVHRDLKPENILLDSERNVRVADFGFGNNWHKDRHLTTYCGSPFYAAPEMVSGTPYIGPETDVWSLGVILYVLVCGRLPFDASDLPQLFAQIKRGNYQKPREGSIDVCSLIHRMLTVDSKRRATLADVLRSRWMRADGMESMVTALPALSTAPTTLRPVSAVATRPSNQPQAKSTALPTYHPNDDISTTMPAVAQAQQYRNEPQNRHSYHPPGTHELRQQEYQHQAPQSLPPVTINTQYMPLTPITTSNTTTHPVDDQDDMMSDVSPANSPTETLATISPSTPVPSMDTSGGIPYRDPSKYRPSSDDKHHPYKVQHARTMSNSPDNVTISMNPSSDTLIDGFDCASKKKRKALTKLRQFFRFENKV
ncbi:NUAK SNF1-like kinase 2 [Haplosporangium bisporale]|nr:NUAK SNF1-like kinase 2 [Haplosporangium bisporale]KFH66679.1 CAMK/CAMKL protein kinase [Podila verticillata NRRL 6337]